MKRRQAAQGRETVTINHMSIFVNGDTVEAHSIRPFDVRAKWSYEPFVKGDNWEEPDTPEWFAFDGLYCYQETFFVTEEGVLVTIPSHVELTNILNKHQLQIIEDVLREGWKRDAEDSYEPMLDYEYGI